MHEVDLQLGFGDGDVALADHRESFTLHAHVERLHFDLMALRGDQAEQAKDRLAVRRRKKKEVREVI
jgi:hypothetical protein